MRAFAIVALAAMGTAALAGCMGGDAYTLSIGGSQNLDRTDTWNNPSSRARASMSMGGSGDVTLELQDAQGQTVLTMSCSGSGGCSETQTSATGEPGDWTVQLDGQVEGGLSISINPA